MSIFAPNFDERNSNHDSDGSLAMRSYLSDLFLEQSMHSVTSTGPRHATSGNISDYFSDSEIESDSDVSFHSDSDSDSGNDSDSVSLSSNDEEEATQSTAEVSVSPTKTTKTNTKTKIKNKRDDLNGGTNHTRRRRFRSSSRSLTKQEPQKLTPQFSVAPDNARGARTRSVSTYQSRQLSASAHCMGSRTGISSSSVDNWRNSLHQQRIPQGRDRNTQTQQHRDSRWSTSNHGHGLPKGKIKNRVKSYDFGFVNDSLHKSTSLKNRSRRSSHSNSLGNYPKSLLKNKEAKSKAFSLSCQEAIDSAVRVMNSSASCFSDSDSGGEEFYDDEEVEDFSVTPSKCSSITSSITSNSLNFGRVYRQPTKTVPSSRTAPARTRSGGELPRLPRRTKDDIFEYKETIRPLKGKDLSEHGSPTSTITSTSSGFLKKKVRRSLSDDAITVASRSYEAGRWAATITTQGARDPASPKCDSLLKCPSQPQRMGSRSNRTAVSVKKAKARTTGRNSNHSIDSSDTSDSDNDFDFHADFHASFAQCQEDESLAATVSTTGSSDKGNGSESMASFEKEVMSRMLLKTSRHSSTHPRRRNCSIPDSLRKLPQNSFHDGSTISSKSMGMGRNTNIGMPLKANKHPGKRLLTSGVRAG